MRAARRHAPSRKRDLECGDWFAAVAQRVRRGECLRRLVVGGDHRRFRAGARQHLEIGGNHDAERAKGAEVEPRHVVAGDVLDDHATGFGDGAARVRDRDADQEIAQGAGAVAQRSPATGGDEPADCRVRAAGRIERQTLPMLGQDRLDVAKPGARRQPRGRDPSARSR